MKYTEKKFKKTWKQAKNDLREILSLVRCLLYDKEDGIRRINFIQDDLYERHIIPFKMSSEEDFYKIGEVNDNDIISDLLYYFQLANTELKRLRNEIFTAS
jgi:hypothetical protein